MRIFRHWVAFEGHLEIENVQTPATVYGGSNDSKEAAEADARQRLESLQRKVSANAWEYKDESYVADILEEIIEVIDEDNVVTRNRYGALVLNSRHLMFIDIDNCRRTIFDYLFRSKLTDKEIMLRYIEKEINRKFFQNYAFRIYETTQGYRVMVLGKNFNPRGKLSQEIMKAFGADWLYASLCVKQNCYRARLTPKPSRIKQKGIKVKYLRQSEEEVAKIEDWAIEYELKAHNYSTCKFIKQIGKAPANRVVVYHDRMTRCKDNKKLA